MVNKMQKHLKEVAIMWRQKQFLSRERGKIETTSNILHFPKVKSVNTLGHLQTSYY